MESDKAEQTYVYKVLKYLHFFKLKRKTRILIQPLGSNRIVRKDTYSIHA